MPDNISTKAAKKSSSPPANPSKLEAGLGDAIQQILDKTREIFDLDVLTLLLFRKIRSVKLSGASGPEVGPMDQGWSKSIEPWLVSCKDEKNCEEVMAGLEEGYSEILGPLLTNRKIVFLSQLKGSQFLSQKLSKTDLPCRSLVLIPMVIEGELFAGLLGLWVKERHFSHWESKVAELVGSHMLMVFRTARLQSSLFTQVERLQALLEISTVIYSSLNFQGVIEKVIQHAKNLAGADGCSIYLLEQDSQSLKPLITNYEEYRDQIMNFSLKFGEGLTGKVAQTGLGIISNYAEVDTRTIQIPGTPEEPESLMSVPLMWSGVVIGVITINAKGHKRFTEEDLNLLTIFARLVADALENARLYEDLEKAYKDLSGAQEQLVRVERLRALGEMAGGVAHDFNNVLGAILGRAQLLMRNASDPEIMAQLKKIEQSALDGAGVVKRIQEFTRVHKTSDFVPVDLNQIIESAIEQTQPQWRDQAGSQNIQIQIIRDLKPVTAVEGIASELQEVVANLIFNSVDAIRAQGEISIATYQDDRGVYLRLSDNGEGMTEEVRKRVFDPFFTTKGKKGTGLGLSVAYGIISRHKGEISVESQAGKGTTTVIRFPRLVHSDESERVGASSQPNGENIETAKKPERKFRILVVDDDENIRAILCDILSMDGHQVEEADSGLKAVELFEEKDFDLVITDLGMPGMSGWEVAKNIRASDPAKPVIMISGWGGQIDKEQIKAARVNFLLSKPFNIDQIRSVIARATEPKKLERSVKS